MVVELDPDDLKEVPCAIWPDAEHFGRIGISVQVDDDDRIGYGVFDVSVIDAMTLGR